MAIVSTSDPLVIERPFNWGVLLVSDQFTDDIPGSSQTGFSVSQQALAIAVRHAQDVDYDDLDLEPDDVVPPTQVRVRVLEGRCPQPTDFDCQIAVPSGKLSIGDAEHEVLIDVESGTYRIEVALDVAEHPESVEVWWSPAIAERPISPRPDTTV